MTDAGEWLISTAKRNPEALLVLVAGCALLMRGGGSSYRVAEQTGSGVSGSNAPWNVSRTTETEKASEIVSELKDRIAGMTAQRDQLTNNITYLQGAVEDIDYFKSIWSGAQRP